MKRKLDMNERLVFKGMGCLRNPDGSKGPAFRTYIVVDTTEAPETAEILQEDEALEEIGYIAGRRPDRSFLPAKRLFRKIVTTEIDQKTNETGGEASFLDDVAKLFASKFKEYIKNGGMISK